MRFRKGVIIKHKPDAGYLVPMSAALAKLSQAARLNEIERSRQEAGAMAVALAQPHRAVVVDARGRTIATPDSERLGTALGRFCVNHRPRPLAPWLEDAGKEYAAVVWRFKRAMGFTTFRNSGDPLSIAIDDETATARREKSEMDKHRIDAVLLAVDRQGPVQMEAVCFDDIDPPWRWSSLLSECLMAAAEEWGLAPKNIRNVRFED